MNVDVLIAKYPRLWHMAADQSWPSIKHHGLLSTSALLDLYGYSGQRRDDIESRHRTDSIYIDRAGLPCAVIRDQKPIQEASLRRCLPDGMKPEDWYRILNAKTFFWLTEERVSKLLNAKTYRDLPHIVLVVDTSSLLKSHQSRVLLSPINSGATRSIIYRDACTFSPIADFPYERRRKRGANAVVELVVEGGVPDIADHTLFVQRRMGDRILETIWTRDIVE